MRKGSNTYLTHYRELTILFPSCNIRQCATNYCLRLWNIVYNYSVQTQLQSFFKISHVLCYIYSSIWVYKYSAIRETRELCSSVLYYRKCIYFQFQFVSHNYLCFYLYFFTSILRLVHSKLNSLCNASIMFPFLSGSIADRQLVTDKVFLQHSEATNNFNIFPCGFQSNCYCVRSCTLNYFDSFLLETCFRKNGGLCSAQTVRCILPFIHGPISFKNHCCENTFHLAFYCSTLWFLNLTQAGSAQNSFIKWQDK